MVLLVGSKILYSDSCYELGPLLDICFAGYKQIGFWEFWTGVEEAREIVGNKKEKEMWPPPWVEELWGKSKGN